jgi:4-amino-4-deoxy-L-arabinose transferase-like glycosyltransferase
VALALVTVPLLAYQILDRRTVRPGVWSWLGYLGTALGLGLPWYAILAWRDPSFLREFFWNHHVLLRFVQPLHPEPVWFYLPVLLLGMFPWTLLLPALMGLLTWPSGPVGTKRPAALGFLLVCCSWCIVFFSAADCKRIGYILPAMPALALALGYILDRRLPSASLADWREGWRQWTFLPYWATQGVLASGMGLAVCAWHTGLLRPAWCALVVAVAIAGMVCSFSWRGQRNPSGSWASCGFATFALLFLAVQFLLPNYYRKFSMRAQIRTVQGPAYHAKVPVACYPHGWDSVDFYLQREDSRWYSHDCRDELIADLHRRPETIVFVKSGSALNDLLQNLPSSLEFVPRAQSRTVTAGLVHRRN